METSKNGEGFDKESGKTAGSEASQEKALPSSEAFLKLKEYFETRPACRKALSHLRAKKEIAVRMGGDVDCAIFVVEGQPKVEKRAAQQPDFHFDIRPETIYVLSREPSEEIGDIGVAIFKEILAGNISVKVSGGLMSILTGGYLEMIASGGSHFASILAAHGFSGAHKIMSVINKLRQKN